MTPFTRLAVLALVAFAQAQYSDERAPRYIASEPKQTAAPPVAILKQINRMQDELNNITTPKYPVKSAFFDHLAKIENLLNEDLDLTPMRHNEDGSYTYGYEAADGSFKIETKSPAGEVKGKYGYKDDTGKVRVIEYGANKYGFQPAGEGITVAPPTLVDETKEERQRQENRQNPQQQARRNQYQPAPAQAIDYDYNDDIPAAAPPAPRPAPRPQQQYRPQPAPQQQYRPAPQPQQQYNAPQPSRQQFGVPAPTPAPYRPPQQSAAPAPPKPQFFAGAAPVPAEDNFFNPEPVPQRRTFQQQPQKQQQQAYRPSNPFPDFTDAAPSQQYNSPQSHYAPQPPTRNQNQPYSMLDELLKEYALPKNGAAPLHDISFGSY